MKKFIVYVLTLVMIVLLAVVVKNISKTKYSHNDIKNLIAKGLENMDNMNNVYFKKEGETGDVKYYYKGDKMKMVIVNSTVSESKLSSAITNLKEGKQYYIREEQKIILITKDTMIFKGIQNETLEMLEIKPASKYQYELEYIRDEKIDNKDCIFAKELIFLKDTKEYHDVAHNSEGDVPVYWIEKSTGFIRGVALMKTGENKATPETLIKDIQVGNVTDSEFELPTDKNYEIIDLTNK